MSENWMHYSNHTYICLSKCQIFSLTIDNSQIHFIYKLLMFIYLREMCSNSEIHRIFKLNDKILYTACMYDEFHNRTHNI